LSAGIAGYGNKARNALRSNFNTTIYVNDKADRSPRRKRVCSEAGHRQSGCQQSVK
jgi:hypothetical protein